MRDDPTARAGASGYVVLRGGRVLDPAQGLDAIGDVHIDDGIIVGEERSRSGAPERVIDVAGKLVCPGLIDIHVHLREPGFEYKEDIETGTRAAAAGGFTTVCCMPNTRPAIDSAAVVRQILERATVAGSAHVLPIGAATREMDGAMLAEVYDLKLAGAIAISDDAFPIQDAGTMRRVLEYCHMHGLVVMTHNEDKALTAGGSMNEGAMSAMLGLPGMPAVAEDVAAHRNICLAELTGCRLHLLHISTSGTVDLLRTAKARGVPVTGEACPHHWTLTDARCDGYDADAKMNPPLRTQADCDAVIAGIVDGTIDCIVTDHAPHARYEKEVEFDAAPFGILGLETAFPLVYTSLVLSGHISLARAIELMTSGPAAVLGLQDDAGTLRPGARADIAVIDLERKWVVDRAELHSKSHNTPYHGTELRAKPEFTVCGGRIVDVGTACA